VVEGRAVEVVDDVVEGRAAEVVGDVVEGRAAEVVDDVVEGNGVEVELAITTTSTGVGLSGEVGFGHPGISVYSSLATSTSKLNIFVGPRNGGILEPSVRYPFL
jgi:hypothetical protein